MPHRAARPEGSEAGRVLQTPGSAADTSPVTYPQTPHPHTGHDAASCAQRPSVERQTPDRRQPGNMAVSAQRRDRKSVV